SATAGGTLAAGASAVVGFDVRVTPDARSLTEIDNVAHADFVAVTTGAALSADSPPAVMPGEQSGDLSLGKTVTPGEVDAGGDVSYTLVVHNAGPSDATGVTLQDTVPDGIEGVGALAGQGACTVAGAAVSCALGTLPAGGSAQVLVSGRAAA